MKAFLKLVIAMSAVLFVFGCQKTDPMRTTQGEKDLQPREVASVGASPYRGRAVAWGGTIVRIENLKDRTRLSVLGFPLDDNGAPRTEDASTGRFIADYWSFLDPADYAVGRRVTVRGTVAGIKKGTVGDAPYDYPKVEAAEVRLWPAEKSRDGGGKGWWPPNLHIGIGVYGRI